MSNRNCLRESVKNVVAFWTLTEILTIQAQLQDQYIGCFYDIGSQSNAMSNDTSMTIEKCIASCQGTTYASIQNGNRCTCRNDYGVQVLDKYCSVRCTGSSSEFCGGAVNLGHKGQQVTYVVYSACSIGTYGTNCNQACHCEGYLPCDRLTGNCPIGCYGNWNWPTCNSGASVSQQYLGCYSDYVQGNRALEFMAYDNFYSTDKNTIELCIQTCAINNNNNNYTYAGAESSTQCFCGDNGYDRFGRLNESSCYSTCQGNANEFCGAKDAISVYSVCQPGTYGKLCARRCNCFNNSICTYLSGSCPSSLCRAGWKGTSCNIRDCATNNGACNKTETCTTINLSYASITACRCPEGSQRNKTWEACRDIDECQENIDNCDNTTTNCSNTVGSYQCICKEGLNWYNDSTCTVAGISVDNKKTIIGAVVGSVLGVIAVATVVGVTLLLLRRRRNGHRSIGNNRMSSITTTSANDLMPPTTQENNSMDNAPYNVAHYETYYNTCLAVKVQKLPEVLRYKLSVQHILDKEFKQLPLETKDPTTVGKNKEVRKKNRFRNIIPYDKNRVILSSINGIANSDYINASLIKGYSDTDKLIATQGPTPDTVKDFWRMVCEKDVGVIVMITDLTENNKVKCAKYWADVGEHVSHQDITITTTNEDHKEGYILRIFKVVKGSKRMKVSQFHFLNFPDHGAPQNIDQFLKFLRKVRKSGSQGEYTLVHCSAGAGRTGTFIAIDYLMEQVKAEGHIDIFRCLQHLREQRPQMIQNLAQYQFVHKALLYEYTVGDTTLPCASFPSTFQKLKQVQTDTGLTKLEAQVQNLQETAEPSTKQNKSRVASKRLNKNKIAEMEPAFIKGWKKADAYLTVKCPTPRNIEDFYSLCKEFNCRLCIYLDEETDEIGFPFPTKDKPVALHSSTVVSSSSLKELYGSSHKIAEMKTSEGTYANVAVYANARHGSNAMELTVFGVTASKSMDTIDARVLVSLNEDLQSIQSANTDSPIAVISRSGYSVSAFCLASLIAFDMIKDENEVDLFQIVKDLRKTMPQFQLSLVIEIIGTSTSSSINV